MRSNGNTNTDCTTYRDTYTECHANTDTYGNSDAHAYSYAPGNTKTAAHAASSADAVVTLIPSVPRRSLVRRRIRG
jgi:hypothetical protein